MRSVVSAILFFLFSISLSAQDTSFVTATDLENVDYPYPVKYIHLTIQGENVKLAYMDVQPSQPNGKTVMLLHGKNFNGAYWDKTSAELQKEGFRVIIPDQLGFGKSTKPDKIQYSFQLLAHNTKAILDSLQIKKITVLGHSMGGMLATRFVLMYPGLVDKLILENPIGLEDWKRYVPYQTIDEWYKTELNQNYTKIKQYQLKSYYGNQWKPEYEKWVIILAGWTKNRDYPIIAWNSALQYDMIFTQPVCYEFDAIKVPTLLIIGQRDRTALLKDKAPKDIQERLGDYPKLGKETAKKIKNSQLFEMKNVGHLPHIEAFDKFISSLKSFLKN